MCPFPEQHRGGGQSQQLYSKKLEIASYYRLKLGGFSSFRYKKIENHFGKEG
jgi:hypothetical protein